MENRMTRPKVLITGMSGLIGTAVCRQLGTKYVLSALNRRPVEGVPSHQADIADLAAIEPAFAGIDVVAHLAARSDSTAPWDDVLHHNIIGTYNVFEAARRAGVRRIVYASSGATVSAIEREPPYAALAAGRYAEVSEWRRLTHESPVRPQALYGVSKVFGEALGRHYADAYGMSVICLRIGAVNRDDRPTTAREFSVWLSQRDAVRGIDLAISAPLSLRFEIVFLTSANRWGYRDLEHARTVLGYVPQDRAEDHR
jgi:nucleoside-diphosphate-sugar epimerase